MGRIARIRYLTLIAAIGVMLALTAGVAVGVTMDGPDEDVHIAESIETGGEEVEVIVVFDGPDASMIAQTAQPTAALKQHAAKQFGPLLEQARSDPAVEVTDTFWLAQAALVEVDTSETDLDHLAGMANVVAIQDNARVSTASATESASSVPAPQVNATQTGDTTYGLEQINAPDAWAEFDTQGAGATVAVLDTGINANHPDIDVSEWQDFNPDDPSATPQDYDQDNWHGTHVAGTVAGGDDSGEHIGVAPEAELFIGAVLTEFVNGQGPRGQTSDIINGMEWAVDNDVDVISMSLGSGPNELPDPAFIQAVQNAHAAGSTVVAATHNYGYGTATSPGDIYDAISVGATDENREVPAFSGGGVIDTDLMNNPPSYWPTEYNVPDIAAPGTDVLSASGSSGYAELSGTSMATPHVSGVLALVESAAPQDLTPADHRELFMETAVHPDGSGDDIRYGHGIIDSYRILSELIHADATGTVIDTATGEPLDGAEVTFTDAEGETHTAVTDSFGSFIVQDLIGDDAHELSVTRDGFAAHSETGVMPPPGDVLETQVTLAGDASVELELVGTEFDAPITDASIEFTGPFGSYPIAAEDNGTYTLEGIPSTGTYEATIDAEGYADISESIAVDDAGQHAPDPLALSGDATLEIAVSEAGGGAVTDADIVIENADGDRLTLADALDDEGTLTQSVPGLGDAYTVEVSADNFIQEAFESDPVDAGESVAVEAELRSVADIPGFTVGIAAAALLLAGYAIARRRP